MTAFLLYIARAGLYLSLFYAFYLLVMRRTTFFRLNRVLLLLGSYLCLLLPFIHLRTATTSVMASELTMVAVGTESTADAAPLATPATSFPWSELILSVYLAGALAVLLLFALSTLKMGRLIRKGEIEEMEGCRLVLMDQDVPSFSWGRKVVMSRKDLEGNPAIFTHEQMHVRCRHSRDLVLLLPIQILFWWNPLVWITREELRLLHEYEADEGVLKKGIDATQYQLLLVRKAVGELRFTLASGFQHAKLKNRIAMMMKSASSGWMRWSYLALIPVLAVLMYACNSPKSNKAAAAEPEEVAAEPVGYEVTVTDEPEAVPFNLVEVKPTFNGGDANEFSVWVNSHLKYPEQAKKDGLQGRVMIQFIIGSDGILRDAVVVRSAGEELDAEALRVISASPKWEPGYDADGNAVPVTFNFPIIFQLK